MAYIVDSCSISKDEVHLVINSATATNAIIGDNGDEIMLLDGEYRPVLKGRLNILYSGKKRNLPAGVTISKIEKAPRFDCSGILTLANMRFSPRNIVVKNSTFGRTKGRGMIIQGSNVLLSSNNTFGTSYAGIYLGAYLGGHGGFVNEGLGVNNAIVRNNRISNSARYLPTSRRVLHLGAIAISPALPSSLSTPFPLMSDITVTGNKIIRSGTMAALVHSARNVKIYGNAFEILHRDWALGMDFLNFTEPLKSFHIYSASDIEVFNNKFDSSYRGLSNTPLWTQ
jgi:hypothetical protein